EAGRESLTKLGVRTLPRKNHRKATGGDNKTSLSMRSYVKGLQFRLQHKLGKAYCDWRELIASDLERHVWAEPPEGRSQRVSREARLAMDIAGREDLTAEQQRGLWADQTGLNPQNYYRALRRGRDLASSNGQPKLTNK